MEIPKTYLDRADRKNQEYLFISYSHTNPLFVYNCLNVLYDKGVDFWYDAELATGDIWIERVKQKMSNIHCKGAIVFLDKNALASEAVAREISVINELAAQRTFGIYPVLVGLDNYSELLNTLIVSGGAKWVGLYAKLLQDGDRIYEAAGDDLIDNMVKFAADFGAIEIAEVEVRDLNWTTLTGETQLSFELGVYPASDKESEKIAWKLIHREGSKLFFVSKYCLCFLDYAALPKISPRMFDLEKEESVLGVTPITKSIIERFKGRIGSSVPTDHADRDRPQKLRLFWVMDDSNPRKYYLYNSNNFPVCDPVPVENERFTAGVRLLMVVDDTKINIGGQENGK